MSNTLTKDKTSTKEGYKKTKLGWIPEGWETPEISDVFNFLRTSSFSRNQLNYKEESEIYYIHYGDIHATYKTPILDFEKIQTVPRLNDDVTLPANVDYLKDGDVIIADASEDYEGIGTAIELQNTNKKKVISGLHTFALRDREGKTVQGFRTYIFKNPLVKKALKTIATGSKVFGISKSNVQNFKIVLPPLPEQHKIAQILSTWNKAIALQEQLITQKQALKKGLMQDLLTGKKRFPGFEEEWSTPIINEVFNFIKTTSFSRAQLNYSDKNQIYYIHYGDIHSKYKKPILDLEETQEIPKLNSDIKLPNSIQYLKNGDVIIADASEDYNGVGKAIELQNVNEKKVISGLHTFALRDKKDLTTSGFRAYIFKNPLVKKALKTIATGSKVYGISKGNVQKFQIVLPSIEEQKKIASVLSNFDTEIEKLITHKESLIQQKQGLMQQLLGGEKRVKI